ncbi:MAG: hypothetical protein HQK51_11065 [Oligoflexia bacterium]|nr:hypothetical protein [Oligoflexia bacterium]
MNKIYLLMCSNFSIKILVIFFFLIYIFFTNVMNAKEEEQKQEKKTSSDSNSKVSYSDNIQEVLEYCGETDWSKVTCNTGVTNNSIYDGGGIYEWWLTGAFVRGIDYFTDSDYDVKECRSKKGSKVAQILDGIDKIIPSLPKTITACQKGCLAKCISSKVIKYNHESTSCFFGNCEKILNNEKGDCKQFSKIAKILMDYLGVESKITASNFNRH